MSLSIGTCSSVGFGAKGAEGDPKPQMYKLRIVLVASVLLGSSEARAQVDPQRATDAQALFEQAIAEIDAGQFASACKKLEEVTRLVPDGVGGKYALGECYARLGRLASAWTQFSFAQQVATRLGQIERAENARKQAETLKPKLATLSVIVPVTLGALPGISVIRDGIELREPQWGTALYVDAGQHEVVVTAPGHTTWKKQVEVLTDGVQVKFSVPGNAIKLDPKMAAKAAAAGVPIVFAPPAPDRTWQKPVGMAAVGAGAMGFSLGAVLGALAISTKNASNASGHCNVTTNRCDDVGRAQRQQALELGNASTGLFITGAVVAVGGAILWLTAPPNKNAGDEKKNPARDDKVRVSIDMGPKWLGVQGAF